MQVKSHSLDGFTLSGHFSSISTIFKLKISFQYGISYKTDPTPLSLGFYATLQPAKLGRMRDLSW